MRPSPACARSDFRAGLYPLAAVRCIVAAGPAIVLFGGILFAATAGPAGGGGVAEELWGRVGASGLASARVGLRRHSLLT